MLLARLALFYVSVHGFGPNLAAIGPNLDPNFASQNRQFDRFVPRIRSSAELMVMSSRPPDQNTPQDRLKTAQHESQRLREENALLRAMPGIDHPPTTTPPSQQLLVPMLS